ncbi:MAG: leucine-rich repeat protein [Clostridiales bacterium]|jgi:hypothetical protein|nr:leucine-rich repeat protein [Clostridiales bacterium]
MLKTIIKAMIRSFIAVAAIIAIQVTMAQPAFAENSEYRYSVVNESYVVIEKYLGTSEIVEIPSSIGEYPVTILGYASFEEATVKKVIIPNTVTEIGTYAFHNCRVLESVSIPDSVTSIGNLAFFDCSNLKSIVIPNGVTSINYWAFAGCNNLESVSIPDSVTSIGDSAFYSCHSLKSIVIPYGVTSINVWTFAYCESLESVTIPDSVTSIGEKAFYVCTGLKTLTIPDSVTEFGKDAFSGNTTMYCNAGSPAHKYFEQNDTFYVTNQEPTPFPAPHLAKEPKNANPSSITTETIATTSENPARVTLQTVINPNGNISVLNKNTDSAGQFYIYEYSPNSTLIGKVAFYPELPMVGSFTKDKDGNYYIAYGGTVDIDSDWNAISFMIVKYGPAGNELLTFNKTAMDTTSESPDGFASVKAAFTAGFCRLEISGDKIAAHFSRLMLADKPGDVNHQASTAVVLDKNTFEWLSSAERRHMDLAGTNLEKRHIPYSSHSFDQFLLPINNGHFMYVDRGDAYPRAFKFTSSSRAIESFSFFGETGDNNTFSELGGLAASTSGFVLVGSYEEGRPASTVKKLLALVLDKALLSVSNPIWLPNSANSSGKGVESPKITQIGENKYLVMWMSGTDTYSMIIDEKGNVTSPEKKLATGVSLNTQDVLRYNTATGLVHWTVSASSNALRLYSYDPVAQVIVDPTVTVSEFPSLGEISIPASGNSSLSIGDIRAIKTTAFPERGVYSVPLSSGETAELEFTFSWVDDGPLNGMIAGTSHEYKGTVSCSAAKLTEPFQAEVKQVVKVLATNEPTATPTPIVTPTTLPAVPLPTATPTAVPAAPTPSAENPVVTPTATPAATPAPSQDYPSVSQVAYIGLANSEVAARANTPISRYEMVSMLFAIIDEADKNTYVNKADFTDLPVDSKYRAAIGYLSSKGIVNGYPDKTFRGDAPITRAEFSQLAGKFFEIDAKGSLQFNDVNTAFWAYNAILNAYNHSWIVGYPDNTFRSQNNVSLAESVTIINNMFNFKAKGTNASIPGLNGSEWYYNQLVIGLGQ